MPLHRARYCGHLDDYGVSLRKVAAFMMLPMTGHRSSSSGFYAFDVGQGIATKRLSGIPPGRSVSMPSTSGGVLLPSGSRGAPNVSMPSTSGGILRPEGVVGQYRPQTFRVSMPSTSGGVLRLAPFTMHIRPIDSVSMPSTSGGVLRPSRESLSCKPFL